ncbi:unnamed protein product [Parajaminaea phylloscopi]
MLSFFRQFVAAAVAVSACGLIIGGAALPSGPDGVTAMQQLEKRGAELFEELSQRSPSNTWFQEQLKARLDRIEKRGQQPVTDGSQLTASSHEAGGQNYTGYKNPVPAEFTKHPQYAAFSAFDWHSLNLGTHQELIELDLFLNAVNQFTEKDFADAGLSNDDRALLHYFGLQEIGHAQVLSNLLGAKAPKACKYEYPYTDVRSYLEFNEGLTRWGESGVYGFLPSLDNRANAQILLQSIATEARQQYTFRQWLGVDPVKVWFETGIPQAWAWTLLSKYIKSCPSSNVPVGFSIFPELTVLNQPDIAAIGEKAGGAAIARNTSKFVNPGDTVKLSWDQPGKTQGPYKQKTEVLADDKTPRFAAWVNQYNVTYTALENISKNGSKSYASTKFPSGNVLPGQNQPTLAGTVFIAITNSADRSLTPLNLTLINGATLAGPALFQAS